MTDEGGPNDMRARSVEDLRAFVRSLPGIAWATDAAGGFLAWNEGFERAIGVDEAAMRARTSHAQLAGTELAITSRATGRAMLLEVDESVLRSADGERLGVLSVARDVTEARRAERDLRERHKEQQCVHDVVRVTERTDLDELEVLRAVGVVD